jgi:hypothetical protein
MVRDLLGIATGAESEAVNVAAIRDALDPAGVSAKQALELSTARRAGSGSVGYPARDGARAR